MKLSSAGLVCILALVLCHSTLAQDFCNGRLCSSGEFCERHDDPSEDTCQPKKGLTEPCEDDGQCGVSNGQCSADSKACECRDKFVRLDDRQCVPQCSRDEGNLLCNYGQFCSSAIGGCLPRVDLNQGCTVGAGDDQCKTENSKCTAVEGGEKCVCDPTTNYVEKDGACVLRCTPESCSFTQFCGLDGFCKAKPYLGESCDLMEDHCLQENSECKSESSICGCRAEFVDYYGSCLPKCPAEGCGADQFCDSTWEICNNKSPLHQGCTIIPDESTCVDINAECKATDNPSPTCECKADFVDKSGTCTAVCTDASCSADQYCNAISGSCEPKLALGQSCTAPEKNDCAGDSALVECGGSPPRCKCTAGNVETGGTCVKGCEQNSDCGSTDLYCNKAFHICNPKIGLNGFCDSEDEEPQCKTANANCVDNVCRCVGNFAEDKETSTCQPKCTAQSPCSDSDKWCDVDTGSCNRKVDLDGQCVKENLADECRSANAECKGSICTCKEEFVRRDNSCVARCTRSSDCEGGNEYCQVSSGLCFTKAELNQECTEADQCSSPDAECVGPENGIKRCTCKPSHAQWSSICRLKCTSTSGCQSTEYCNVGQGLCYNKVGLKRPCTENIECASPLAVCKQVSLSSPTKTCECDSDAGNIDKGTYCIQACNRHPVCDASVEFCDALSLECQKRVPVNSRCTAEGFDQCLGPLTTCVGPAENNRKCDCVQDARVATGAEVCSCADNFVESTLTDRRCLKKSLIAESCEEPQQCQDLGNGQADAVQCTGGVCLCQTNYVDSSDRRKCLKKAALVEETCEEPQQCQDLANGQTDAVQCTGGYCRCQANFVDSSDRKTCLKMASALDETCVEGKQCFNLGNGDAATTTCSGGKCACTDTSILFEKFCYLRKKIGNACANDKECSVGIEGTVRCDAASKTCACSSDSKADTEGLKCVKDSPSESDSSVIKMNIFLILFTFVFLKLN